MADLSRRFAELMARMARTDADLFRTLGEQNAAVRQMVDEVLPDEGLDSAPSAPGQGPAHTLTSPTAGAPALAPSPLLSIEECSPARLRARFRTLPPARAFLEEKLGPPPAGIGRLTWAVVEKAFRSGSWPAGKTTTTGKATGSATALAGMEQRLGERFDRMEARLNQIELLLLQVLEARHRPTLPPS
jgi:hypothetical protein